MEVLKKVAIKLCYCGSLGFTLPNDQLKASVVLPQKMKIPNLDASYNLYLIILLIIN